MSEELIEAAYALQEAAKNYRDLYEKENHKTLVVWLRNDETGEGIFMADRFNTGLIKARLGEVTHD